MEVTEATLIAAARDGDHSSYGELVRRHQSVAFRVAMVITRSAADSQDVTQEAFVKAWKALDRFDPERPFRPWLLSIVANEARNRRRGAARRFVHELRAGKQAVAVAAGVPSAEAVAVRDIEGAGVLDAVDRLPDKHRQVIYLRYLMELDERETAAALGIAPGTVKSRASRARVQLAELLRVADE